MRTNMIVAAIFFLMGILSMAVAADERIIDLYAGWGHEKDALSPDNVTMLELYYAFNISGADWDSLNECELYDFIGIVRQYQEYDVLVNYLILRDGTAICLADKNSKVWHARGYNDMSLGIRIVALNATIAERLSKQKGMEVPPGPNDQQYAAFARLVAELKDGAYPNIVDITGYDKLKASQNITMPDSEIDWQRVDYYLKRHGSNIRL